MTRKFITGHGRDHRPVGSDPIDDAFRIYVGTPGVDSVDALLAANPIPYATGDTPGPVPFENGYTNDSTGTYEPVWFGLSVGGWVIGGGVPVAGTAGLWVFTLPVGFRPPYRAPFSSADISAGLSAIGWVEPDGKVYIVDATGAAPVILPGSIVGSMLETIDSPTGPIGSTSVIPVVTIDAHGRTVTLTSASPSVDTIASNPTGADWSNNSHKITSLLDPTNPQDAATKNYVDTAVNGLEWKAACALATAAALPTNVYNNGASGVGATLTAVTTGVLSIDGTPVVVGQRVLVKNEATPANNGVYVVTAIGTSPALYVLTRAADFNQASEIEAGDAVYITGGSTNVDSSWVMTTTTLPFVVGTTGVAFTQFGGNLVSSVFGRTGAVSAVSGDYNETQISFTNNTTNDVSIAKHGYAPKAPNDATRYLDGLGAWSIPAGTASGVTSFAGRNGTVVPLPGDYPGDTLYIYSVGR